MLKDGRIVSLSKRKTLLTAKPDGDRQEESGIEKEEDMDYG